MTVITGNNVWQAATVGQQTNSPILAESFIETPIMGHECNGYEWPMYETKNEVTTVG